MAIDLTPAKCPCCGAELHINENDRFTVCQYCNTRIIVQAAVAYGRVTVEGTVRTKTTDFVIRAGTLEAYNGESTDVVIPDNVISIAPKVFRGCHLRSVRFNKGLKAISYAAFSGCRELTEIEFPETLERIGDFAFSSCSGLTRVWFNEGLTTIGNSAFSGCSGLTRLDLPQSLELIDVNAFGNCAGLTELVLPDNVTVDTKSFEFCSKLEKVTFGEDVILSRDSFFRSGVNEIVYPEDESAWRPMYYDAFTRTPWYEEREGWKRDNLCWHCGGKFNLFTQKCKVCGRKKDYETK